MNDIYFRRWQDTVYVKYFNFYARKQNFEKVMSVCLSVRPSVLRHGIVLLPLDGFSCNLIFAYFPKSVEKIHTLTFRHYASYI